MRRKWPEQRLGVLLELVIDHRGKTPKKLGGEFVDAGVPVVSAIHIKGGVIDWSQRERYVTQEMFEKWMPVRLRRGDVLLTSEAPLGESAIIPTSDDLVLSQRLFALRGKPDVLNSAFLRYFLASVPGQERLNERATGTTVVGIRQEELLKVLVPLPPIAVQRRIAGVLGALDDLIDTNKRLARSLEDLVALVFMAIGFDVEGEHPVPLEDLVDINPQRVKPKGVAPYIDMAALPTDSARAQAYALRPAGSGVRFQNGDTVMARITPCLENGKTAFIDLLEAEEVAVGSTEFIVLHPKPPLPESWAYFLARSPRFREHVIRHMSGSSGRQRCPAESVQNFRIAQPVASQVAQFNRVQPLFSAIKDLDDEAAVARRTRDELLPLLLSGAVTVAESAA